MLHQPSHLLHNLCLLLLAACAITALGCKKTPPKMVLEKSNGDRISGGLVEPLRVQTSLQTTPFVFDLHSLKSLELIDSKSLSVEVTTRDGNVVKGHLLDPEIKLKLEGQHVSIAVKNVEDIDIE